MLVANVDLTMSHVGLGDLNEYALMVLFGNAHSYNLVQGLTIDPSHIESSDGTTLYPAYFMTRLRVPLSNLLSNFKLWKTYTVGVDIKRFGETLLTSNYIISNKEDVPQDVEAWGSENFPTMEGNNLIVAEQLNSGTAKREVANPDPQKIAKLERASRSPVGLLLSRKVRNNGFDDFELGSQFQTAEPINYKLEPCRDAADGHAIIFAKFSEIMDVVEYQFLERSKSEGLSSALLKQLNIVERDIYYYGNCYAGEELSINYSAEIELIEQDDIEKGLNYIPAAYLTNNIEIYHKSSGNLIVMSRAKKIFAIPVSEQENITDLQRFLKKY
ncbi:LnmK family bifunctional acyltransferase/decarboxylase [Aliikangiella sp. IMCC44359]|uniref:LnmK family bifunctional acyltransferase/decarboxylase n=1 Tax=Aliikangiella sp. IMCC44359 TaxID=3459125 RepID=UPI00403B1E3E